MDDNIKTFDSFEEMQQWMRDQTDQANAGLIPTQIELRDDTLNTRYWVRAYPQAQCLIFGETLATARLIDLEAKHYDFDKPEDMDEFIWSVRQLTPRRQAGYLTGECYSILEPDGEWGDSHVSNVHPISKEAFEEAKAAGWKAVDIEPAHLALVGEDVARLMFDYTPTLCAELRAIQESLDNL